MNFVGHSTVTTIDIYGHLFPDDTASKDAMIAASGKFKVAVEDRRTYVGHNAAPQQLRDKSHQVIDIIDV
jgi:hypothetical protein